MQFCNDIQSCWNLNHVTVKSRCCGILIWLERSHIQAVTRIEQCPLGTPLSTVNIYWLQISVNVVQRYWKDREPNLPDFTSAIICNACVFDSQLDVESDPPPSMDFIYIQQ
jgi:hypothetical protein